MYDVLLHRISLLGSESTIDAGAHAWVMTGAGRFFSDCLLYERRTGIRS